MSKPSQPTLGSPIVYHKFGKKTPGVIVNVDGMDCDILLYPPSLGNNGKPLDDPSYKWHRIHVVSFYTSVQPQLPQSEGYCTPPC